MERVIVKKKMADPLKILEQIREGKSFSLLPIPELQESYWYIRGYYEGWNPQVARPPIIGDAFLYSIFLLGMKDGAGDHAAADEK
jgi:hypothetical protein